MLPVFLRTVLHSCMVCRYAYKPKCNSLLYSFPLSSVTHILEAKWSESHSVVSNSLQPHGLYSPWNSPGQNTGVGSCSLLQGIFPTQGWNPGLPHCRQILHQLSHKAGGAKTALWPHLYPLLPQSTHPQRHPCLQELACASASVGNTLQPLSTWPIPTSV